MALKTLESGIDVSKKDGLKEDFFLINESIERIKKFVEALTNLQNPETVEYVKDSKMIKIN